MLRDAVAMGLRFSWERVGYPRRKVKMHGLVEQCYHQFREVFTRVRRVTQMSNNSIQNLQLWTFGCFRNSCLLLIGCHSRPLQKLAEHEPGTPAELTVSHQGLCQTLVHLELFVCFKSHIKTLLCTVGLDLVKEVYIRLSERREITIPLDYVWTMMYLCKLINFHNSAVYSLYKGFVYIENSSCWTWAEIHVAFYFVFDCTRW